MMTLLGLGWAGVGGEVWDGMRKGEWGIGSGF